MTSADRSARDVLADTWERWHAESLTRLLERPAADFAEVALVLLADAGFHVVRDGEVVVDGQRWKVEPDREFGPFLTERGERQPDGSVVVVETTHEWDATLVPVDPTALRPVPSAGEPPSETCGDSGEIVVERPWPTPDVRRPCPACSGEGR